MSDSSVSRIPNEGGSPNRDGNVTDESLEVGGIGSVAPTSKPQRDPGASERENATGALPQGQSSEVVATGTRRPRPANSRSETLGSNQHRALFWTQAKPCEEALPLLADAYNRLADQIEEEWEKNQRLEEQYQALLRHAEAVRDSWLIIDADDAHLMHSCAELDGFLTGSNPATEPRDG